VYSDKFISPEDALQEFKDHLNSDKMTVTNANRVTDDLVFRDIKMRIGIHERTWVKNVVAIGLSAGFIEPLESNGLFTVHEFLLLLVSALDRPHINQWDRDGYNMASGDLFVNM
jgi:tryptophan halogenase